MPFAWLIQSALEAELIKMSMGDDRVIVRPNFSRSDLGLPSNFNQIQLRLMYTGTLDTKGNWKGTFPALADCISGST